MGLRLDESAFTGAVITPFYDSLLVKVTAQGRAESVKVKKSSGYSLLDDAAVAAVRDYEFKPARVGPLVFASEIEVPVHFELNRQ